MRSQPTRDIFPTILQDEEEEARPGELSERDDDWFTLIWKKRETLGERLARTVAEGADIDSSTGIEYTVSVEPETFPVNVTRFAADKEEGAMATKRYTDEPCEISFQTDGSRLNSGRTGAGVVWCDPYWRT